MPDFRYNLQGKWFKGNTHLHSIASDGGLTFSELAAKYAAAGYDFLFRTDHWVSSKCLSDTEDYPLIWLDGTELDGTDANQVYRHIVCLGTFPDFDPQKPLEHVLKTVRQHNGIVILAHPFWTGNTIEHALSMDFDGVEIYNHGSRWHNGKDDGRPHWDAMLGRNPMTLGFCADDAHLRPEHPAWNGGWIHVNIPELTRENVMSAIRSGNFFSTCGPCFENIRFDGETIHVQTSPVAHIRLIGQRFKSRRIDAPDGSTITSGRFRCPSDWRYIILEIEDTYGKRAWTNHLFIE